MPPRRKPEPIENFSPPDDEPRLQPQLLSDQQQQPPTRVDLPIWEDVPEEGAAGAYKLKIQRQTPDGDKEDLGHMPATTSQTQLVGRFPRAAIYLVMPVDDFGRKLRIDPYRIVIPPDHPALTAALSTGAADPGVGGVTPMVIEILQEELRASRAEKDRILGEIAQERARLAEERDRVAQERLSLAVQTVTDNNELQGKILERASRRDDAAQSSIVQILAQQQSAADANFQRQLTQAKQEQEWRLEMIKAQMEADRAKAGIEREERLRRDKEEREERVRRDKEDRDARDRREEEREKAAERMREQDRAYNAQMLSLMKSQADPITSLVKTVGQLEPVSDVLRSLFGGKEKVEEKPKTWVESLVELASTVISAQIEMKKAEMQAMIAQQGEEMTEEEEQALIAQEQQAQIPQAPTAIPPLFPNPPSAAPAVPQTAAQQLMATVGERTRGMDPALQKAGRRGVKALIELLRATPEGEWATKILAQLKADPAIYHYVRAVGIRTAAQEAGADVDLASRITATIDASGLVPADVPRN